MQKSIFESVYYGKNVPYERRVNLSPERRELEGRINAEKQYFAEKLSPDDCRRFEELVNLYSQANLDDEVNIFSHGFTVGALLLLEITKKAEELQADEIVRKFTDEFLNEK